MENRIRKLRIAQGLTVVDLSKLADMSQSYLTEIELGKKQLNEKRIERLAAALKVEPHEIFVQPKSESASKVGVTGDDWNVFAKLVSLNSKDRILVETLISRLS